jgi:hypothetical protein
MTEEELAPDAPEDVHTEPEDAPAQEAGSSFEGDEPPRDYEAEAREMGWVPKEEYNGPNWKDARTFVEHGENILPIVRSQLKRKEAELEAQRKADEERRAADAERLKRLEQAHRAAMKRMVSQHKSEMDSIIARQRAAVDEGNTAEFDRLEKQREALSQAAPEEFEPPAEDPVKNYEQAIQKWEADNQWYREDDLMAFSAERYSQKLQKDNPNLPLEENLRMTTEHIKTKYPEKFGRARKPAHAAVDGGSFFPGTGKKSKGFGDLPPEAKSAYAEIVASGVDMKKEDYAKEYFADE